MYIYIPLTDVTKFTAALSHYIMHRKDVYPYKDDRMMNPSSNVCEKCLIVGHVPTKTYFGANPCYLIFQVNNVNWDYSILFHFGHV